MRVDLPSSTEPAVMKRRRPWLWVVVMAAFLGSKIIGLLCVALSARSPP